jgi:succinate dehydrogenase/fumarate reductase flavoprotein subunit
MAAGSKHWPTISIARSTDPSPTGRTRRRIPARIPRDPALGDLARHVATRHALTAARLIVRSALLRTESRGGHRRSDHPASDERWREVHLDVAAVTPSGAD